MTNRLARLALFFFFALPWLALAQEPPTLSEKEKRRQLESFDLVWETIRDKHWDEKLGGLDWDAVRQELRPKIEQAASPAECRAILANMIGRLGQSHFGILPGEVYEAIEEGDDNQKVEPEKKEEGDKAQGEKAQGEKAEDKPKRQSRRRGDGETGLDVRIVDGQALVTRVDPESPAARLGVKPGWVIQEIRGAALAPLLDRIAKARGEHMADLMLTRSVMNRLSGPVDGEVEVLFLDGQDNLHRMHLPLAAPRGARAVFGNLPPVHVRLETRRLEPKIVYLALNCFFAPQEVMPRLEKAVGENLDADGFILDLRGNPGGIGFMASGVGGWFVQKPDLKLGTMYTRDGNLKFVLNPRTKTFAGPLAILVDGNSASTSEILAGGMKDLRRARIFGTRTAGAALPSVIVRLPNGDGFQYAFANYISEGGKALEGDGVVPDEVVKPQRQALLDGKDPVIEAAVAWIKKQK
jgi:carboxyl-terminal processing protease